MNIIINPMKGDIRGLEHAVSNLEKAQIRLERPGIASPPTLYTAMSGIISTLLLIVVFLAMR